jgi:hypothetical protein
MKRHFDYTAAIDNILLQENVSIFEANSVLFCIFFCLLQTQQWGGTQDVVFRSGKHAEAQIIRPVSGNNR